MSGPHPAWAAPGQPQPGDAPPPPAPRRNRLPWILAGVAVLVVAGIVAALLIHAGASVRSDLSARDQELCGIALDDNESIGYLSTQVDELIKNDGKFSSEGDAFAFQQVPVRRSLNDLTSRIADYGQPDSAGFIDDPKLLANARALMSALFDAETASDSGNSIDQALLAKLRGAIDDLVNTCTG